MAYTFCDLTEEVLQDSPVALKISDIWARAVEKGLDKKLDSVGATPVNSLSVVLHTNVKKANSKFISYSSRPVLFGLKNKHYESIEDQADSIESSPTKTSFKERDLHQLFVTFVNQNEHFELYCKTIFHEQSKKSIKGMDKWLHPDIVGVKFANYNDKTLELLKQLDIPRAKIYSFELKIELNWNNLKESYFQAVSNSSWANEGYLVVFKDINDDELLQEIGRLNASFGIGLITFGTRQEDFKILYQAKERMLDAETINVLIGKSDNFIQFIENVSNDLTQSKDRRATNKYDRILESDEALETYINNKRITR